MSQRNFLRRQMIEYKELNGLRKGFRVSAIVNNEAEQGTVKWIGTIKGIMYFGIEFERPVGNQFPETHGAQPFPGSLSHSRLVFPEDVKTSLPPSTATSTAEQSNHSHSTSIITVMENYKSVAVVKKAEEQEQVQKFLPLQHSSAQDDDHYLLEESVSSASASPSPIQYLCLSENNRGSDHNGNNHDGASVTSGRLASVYGHHHHHNQNNKRGRHTKMNHLQMQQPQQHPILQNPRNRYYSNIELSTTEDDSEFLSTTCSLSSSSSSASSYAVSSVSMSCSCGGGGSVINGNIGSNGDSAELKEFDEKLSSFYQSCSKTRRLIKEFHVKFEELPIHCRFDDGIALMLGMDKLKNLKSELEDTLYEYLERCKAEMEAVQSYSEIILPTEEKKLGREMREIEQSIGSLDHDIGNEIERLESIMPVYYGLQELLLERSSRFAVMKTRLVQVERNLVKDESALSLRLKGIQSILSVLERDHDSSENSEISLLVSTISSNEFVDASRMLSQTKDLILGEKQFLEDVKSKRTMLLLAKESYTTFVRRLSNFQSWYADFMKRLNETKVTGLDFDIQHPALVKEREEKRQEFIQILNSAKNLRASIFDSSAVDKKIENLQDQWKILVDKVYRARSRKTI